MDSEQKIRALIDLCQALAGSGLHVGLSDARPAMSVRASLTGDRIWIGIEDDAFVWRRSEKVRYAVGDPAGAAAEITAYLGGRLEVPDDRP
ncbi:hypothetical protein [Actinoallomurus rhizosphaericola]|uniref:hypothetical protein n=1 Tax=Actinoallomurus rhizosphaericola TaxID=2952536 RepID=UPI002091F456|nr:hypothetical protein [Actinoallomurus rhizosphaericola]MCO5997533.1 hypothetical protein [Actinoallomurus rhizosphaericola]